MESEAPVDKWLLWIGVGMVALSFARSRRHIPYSFLLGAGLNVLNNWLTVGIDEENKNFTCYRHTRFLFFTFQNTTNGFSFV